MRKSVFIAYILVLALTAIAASAQDQINFADLPLVGTPAPVPGGYAGLNWGNFFYVDPSLDSTAGPGYLNLLTHRDVAFIGGEFCAPVRSGCYGIVSSLGGPTAFQAVSAIMAAGYQGNVVSITAYRNGKFIGQMTVPLSGMAHSVEFPTSWGLITEMQIQTDKPGNVVLLELSVYYVAG
jgi:hypothetical protein